VTDEGLEDVIRIAAENQAYVLPSRPLIDDRINQLYDHEEGKICSILDRAVHVALDG